MNEWNASMEFDMSPDAIESGWAIIQLYSKPCRMLYELEVVKDLDPELEVSPPEIIARARSQDRVGAITMVNHDMEKMQTRFLLEWSETIESEDDNE